MLILNNLTKTCKNIKVFYHNIEIIHMQYIPNLNIIFNCVYPIVLIFSENKFLVIKKISLKYYWLKKYYSSRENISRAAIFIICGNILLIKIM